MSAVIAEETLISQYRYVTLEVIQSALAALRCCFLFNEAFGTAKIFSSVDISIS